MPILTLFCIGKGGPKKCILPCNSTKFLLFLTRNFVGVTSLGKRVVFLKWADPRVPKTTFFQDELTWVVFGGDRECICGGDV